MTLACVLSVIGILRIMNDVWLSVAPQSRDASVVPRETVIVGYI